MIRTPLALVHGRREARAGACPTPSARSRSVIRRWPDHPGANHLYIHAVESSPTPERAIPSAQRLMATHAL